MQRKTYFLADLNSRSKTYREYPVLFNQPLWFRRQIYRLVLIQRSLHRLQPFQHLIGGLVELLTLHDGKLKLLLPLCGPGAHSLPAMVHDLQFLFHLGTVRTVWMCELLTAQVDGEGDCLASIQTKEELLKERRKSKLAIIRSDSASDGLQESNGS